jgi:metal-sulfur cluster biosynthetic enzyme
MSFSPLFHAGAGPLDSPLFHAGAGPLDSPLFHAGARPLEERIWLALAEINDPEMPVNLVDLGLIYGLTVDGGRVCVSLTFTAMGCPASDMILGDIRERLLAEPGIEDVNLDVVWDPPWTSARLSAEGRDALRAWGLSV